MIANECLLCGAHGRECDPRCPERAAREAHTRAWASLKPAGHEVVDADGTVECECGEWFPRMDGYSAHVTDLSLARLRGGPTCPYHPDRAAGVEIAGRVLVCAECATDAELVRHAEADWR